MSPTAIEVCCSKPLELVNGLDPGELLLLHGRTIGETLVQDGSFVMNCVDEIKQAVLRGALGQGLDEVDALPGRVAKVLH